MKKLTWDKRSSKAEHAKETCDASGKLKHRYSLKVAKQAVATNIKRFGIPLGIYKCEECKKYHLTSKI